MTTGSGRAPSGQALVASDEARSDLHPSGFDPSRFGVIDAAERLSIWAEQARATGHGGRAYDLEVAATLIEQLEGERAEQWRLVREEKGANDVLRAGISELKSCAFVNHRGQEVASSRAAYEEVRFLRRTIKRMWSGITLLKLSPDALARLKHNEIGELIAKIEVSV